jgi:hypothetical protein
MASKKKTNGGATLGEAATKKRIDKAASKREGVERARYTKSLQTCVEASIIAERGEQLAAVVKERADIEDAKREANAAFREQLAAKRERLDELARAVNEGTELRDVECREVLYPATNEIAVYRIDTNEQIESRAATKEDLQEDLPLAAEHVERVYPSPKSGPRKAKAKSSEVSS